MVDLFATDSMREGNVVAFGDDHQGAVFAFDLERAWCVVEIEGATRERSSYGTFGEFMSQLLADSGVDLAS